MRWRDQWYFAAEALVRQRFRSTMLLLVTVLGVTAVVVLTALGEGARRYVINEFAFLGHDVLVTLPGKKETTGGLPPVMGTAARDLTLDDAYYLRQRLPEVYDVAPIVVGSAPVSYRERSREVLVLGTVPGFFEVRRLSLALGRNLPSGDWRRAQPAVVIGEKLQKELFANDNPIGKSVRVADSHFRVVGVLEGKGDAMGMDLSDGIILPVASAQQLFNQNGLFRLLIRLRPGVDNERAAQKIRDFIKERHQGEEDVTVVSPDAMLAVFDDVLVVMTLGVAAIAAVSLLVAGVLVMNVTWINVSQRTAEIGLLKALGAPAAVVRRLFLTEAVLVAMVGTGIGVLVGFALVGVLRELFPSVPFFPPLWAVAMAVLLAMACGVSFALMPVARAARKPPIEALRNQ